MFARVITRSVPKDKIDSTLKRAKGNLPEIKKQKGYKGMINLTDSQTGEIISISIWDTEQDMKAAEKAPYFTSGAKTNAADGIKIISTKYYTVNIKD